MYVTPINLLNSKRLTFQASIPAKIDSDDAYNVADQLSQSADRLKTMDLNNPQAFQSFIVSTQGLVDRLKTMGGFHVEKKTPRMLQTDAYYVASDFYIHKDAKDKSVYQAAFRRKVLPWMKDMGIDEKDSRLVFYGLQNIMKEILQDPVTMEEIEEADKFFKNANFKWNRKIWERVVKENNGIIPIKIEALPDGSATFPGEPVMQITAEDGYGELAAWFETKLLQVWSTSERASLLRNWLEYNKNLVRENSDASLTEDEITAKAQKMLVDFSDRSCMTPQESEWLGMASLTAFPVTSTMSSIYQATLANSNKLPGAIAMPSLPHRVIESYKNEGDAYKALYNYTKGKVGSYVGDCYDYRNAVTKYLIPLALKAKEENRELGINTKINARPDSGDPYEEVKFTLDKAVEAGLYKEITTRDGRKLKGMTTLGVIQADGMNLKKMIEINNRLIADGYSPADCVSYGVGGFLHDALSRSNMSAAQKLAELGEGENNRPVMKCPIGEPAKESIPGTVKIVREDNESSVRRIDEPGKNEYVVWYDGINGHGIEYKEDFSEVQNRVLNHFHDAKKPNNIFSQGINDLKSEIRSEHRKH